MHPVFVIPLVLLADLCVTRNHPSLEHTLSGLGVRSGCHGAVRVFYGNVAMSAVRLGANERRCAGRVSSSVFSLSARRYGFSHAPAAVVGSSFLFSVRLCVAETEQRNPPQ